jgi:hypothetical protein
MELRDYDEPSDRPWLELRLSDGYGAGHLQARRGELVDVLAGEGIIAEDAGEPKGVVLWREDADGWVELSYLWAFEPGVGTGRALVEAMVRRVPGPIWVVTTNDNTGALRFYQRMGFRLRAVRVGAVDEARRTLKPSIPVEVDGIPVRDELELALDTDGAPGG